MIDKGRASALDRADAWAAPLDLGLWRSLYAECCDAVLAYDRIVAIMPAGPLRYRLITLRPAVLEMLGRAWSLAELATELLPGGPVRDPRLPALLAQDVIADLRWRVSAPPSDPGLRKALEAVREDLWRVAEDAARLAVRLFEEPHETDLTDRLKALAGGVAAAHRSGWTPAGDAPEDVS